LKLKYDELLSSFAFNFNLRPYTAGPVTIGPPVTINVVFAPCGSDPGMAVRVDPMNPTLKAPVSYLLSLETQM
jgi:hypothetical protein